MHRTFILVLVLLMSAQAAFTQSLSSESPPVMIKSAWKGKTVYDIRCTFEEPFGDSLRTAIENPDSWQVSGGRREFEVDTVSAGLMDTPTCFLTGNWDRYDDLLVVFDNQVAFRVIAEGVRGETTRWGLGKGDAIDLNAQRLTDQEALYAFEYDVGVRALERYHSVGGGNVWLRSLSLDVSSKGGFATDDKMRNGTQSSLSLSAHPFYFVGGLVYGANLSLGYQIETRMNEAEDEPFDVIGRRFRVGAEVEVPLTNYPIFRLHRVTRYPRLAMPLTLRLEYLAEGADGDGPNISARLDFQAVYELAFSPYMIVKGELHVSKFFDAPAGVCETAEYYALSFAQDLGVIKRKLGMLAFILGSSEEIDGSNFIFFRISEGRNAPAFEDIDEKAIGLGTYF